MYTENVEYLSCSPFTFDLERGFEGSQVPLHFDTLEKCFTVCTRLRSVHLPIVIAYFHFQIITKGDRNLEWHDVRTPEDRMVFRLPFYTCHFAAPFFTFTMKEIVDQGLLTWEDDGKSGPFLTVMRMSLFSIS